MLRPLTWLPQQNHSYMLLKWQTGRSIISVINSGCEYFWNYTSLQEVVACFSCLVITLEGQLQYHIHASQGIWTMKCHWKESFFFWQWVRDMTYTQHKFKYLQMKVSAISMNGQQQTPQGTTCTTTLMWTDKLLTDCWQLALNKYWKTMKQK